MGLTEIHEPVDGYDELLADKADRFFDRLTPDRIVWRRNWFFHDDPGFYQPGRMAKRARSTAEEASTLFVRSEWQTLRRLAFSGRIVFTVKTQVAPIAELAARPEVARGVSNYLEQASERAIVNKNADGRHRAILDYLHDVTS